MLACVDLELVCEVCDRLWLQKERKKRRKMCINRGSFLRKEEVCEEMKMWMLRIVVSLVIRRVGRRR
jgi:hypothetical protein